MFFKKIYKSPIGSLVLVSNEKELVGVWFSDQVYYLAGLKNEILVEQDNEILLMTVNWLERYFDGKKPEINEIPLHPSGTSFQKLVWKKLMDIPYGSVITYQGLARQVAIEMNKKTMSAQAIGGAVGHNPISIIIPCHRVVGTHGDLVGYASGLDKKSFLLTHEQVDVNNLLEYM